MGVTSKLGRTFGVASLLAGVMAVAAPMASGAWAAPSVHAAGCGKEDNASITGDANQAQHVANESTSSTCTPCVTTDPTKDHESAGGSAHESSNSDATTRAGTSAGTTCSPGGGSSGGTGSGGTGSGGTGSGSTGSSKGSGSTSSGGSSPAPSSTPPSSTVAPKPVASTTAPEVVSTSPSGLVVHTVVVPTDVAPAVVPPATPATADIPTHVLGVSTLRGAPAPTLAYTGGSVTKLFAVGAGLVLLGMGLLLGGRRRSEPQR